MTHLAFRCLLVYICLKKVMVEAYTLSDRIVQQGYNDVQELVGMVLKRPNLSDPELSSFDALKAANAQQEVYGQASGYYVDTTTTNFNTADVTRGVVTSPHTSQLLINLFDGFVSTGYDQWVQIRRLDTTPVLNGTTLSGILYKIVADAFLSPAP